MKNFFINKQKKKGKKVVKLIYTQLHCISVSSPPPGRKKSIRKNPLAKIAVSNFKLPEKSFFPVLETVFLFRDFFWGGLHFDSLNLWKKYFKNGQINFYTNPSKSTKFRFLGQIFHSSIFHCKSCFPSQVRVKDSQMP